jgi:hypothetical protein
LIHVIPTGKPTEKLVLSKQPATAPTEPRP